MVDADTWILFDLGAAASCCHREFAPDWPLLPFSGEPPPDGISFWLHFCVCGVPYSVLSVSRLLPRGYQVELGRENGSMTSPFGQRMKVTRHGSLLLACPRVKPFNPETFADVCEHFHSY